MKKNLQKTQKNKNVQNTENSKNKHFLTTFVCIFLAVVLVFGSTLMIILGVRNSKAVARYQGVTMEKGVASYFIAEFKSTYLSNLSKTVPEACDAPIFWQTTSENGKTYGELFVTGAREYISQILVANYLFERYSEYKATDKEIVDKAVREKLDYLAGGSKSEFNKLSSRHGFDFDDFKVATKMSYKTLMSKNAIYGSNGTAVMTDTALCDEYLNTYSHVYMFLIRTTKDVYDENNVYVGTVDLEGEELSKKEEKISEIDGYIDAIKNGGDIEMSPALFKSEALSNDEFNKDMQAYGYYFNKNAMYTQGFEKEWYPELLDASYEMQIGEYRRVEVDLGVWFIYKEAVVKEAYKTSALEDCFKDFYSDASAYGFLKSVSELSEFVVFTDKFGNIDPISIPYSSMFSASFSQ